MSVGQVLATFGATFIFLFLGGLALIGGHWTIGLTLVLPSLVALAVVGVRMRSRYGPRGTVWLRRLREVAAADLEWRVVDVWFVANTIEFDKAGRIALVAEPGGEPDIAFCTLYGELVEPGRGRLWGTPCKGEVLLLELGGRSLWASAPAMGRVGVAVQRLNAAIPLSTMHLRRPADEPIRARLPSRDDAVDQ